MTVGDGGGGGLYGFEAGSYGSVSGQIPGLLFAAGNPRAV